MITVLGTGTIERVGEDLPPEQLRPLLESYVLQHNEALATYEWMKAQKLLTHNQGRAWDLLLGGLHLVCEALDAGFDPWTPPEGWEHGPLNTYMAPIPAAVREAVQRAIPIFGQAAIEVYDPNPAHFVKPRKLDPLVLGRVDLAEQRLHFLVGHWDIPADMKFIEGHPRPAAEQRPLEEIAVVLDAIRRQRNQEWSPPIMLRRPAPWAPGDFGGGDRAVPRPKWTTRMYTSLGVGNISRIWQG